jgi:uncharacterized protein YebE (UPF0316 family)
MALFEQYQLLIPVLIFLSRVLDVSMSTIRIMFVWAGNKYFATLLGFFEALIWIVAIGQIMKDISNITSYMAYAAGFAAGTFVGMFIEEKLAYGKSIIQVITKKPATELIDYLRFEQMGVTSIEADGHNGKVHIIYTVLNRKQVAKIVDKIRYFNPNAFYTVESVKFVSEQNYLKPKEYRNMLFHNSRRK